MPLIHAHDEWTAAVETELKLKYGITVADTGLDADDLTRYHESNADPVGFVEWYGVRYDLDLLDPDYNAGREQALADGEDVE